MTVAGWICIVAAVLGGLAVIYSVLCMAPGAQSRYEEEKNEKDT